MKLNKSSSVVEMRAARSILAELELKVRREGDYLYIFEAIATDSYSLYTKQDEKDRITKLYVDEGSFSYCLQIDGTQTHSTDFDEYVDYQELIGLISHLWYPEAKPPMSVSMGRGRMKQELICGYHEIIENDKRIEWIK